GGELTYWRQGRSLPYGQGVSYWALAEMVKAQAAILETDSDDEVEAKLTHTVERLLDEDVEWVLSHLRPLVGQASDGASGSREEAFTAWRRLRISRRAAPARPRLRGHPMGRRRPARLHRTSRGLGARRADADCLHGAARVTRAPAGVGRRQAERCNRC